MLITLGLDSTFGGLEAMITALCDEYPRTLGKHREVFVAFLLIGIYICALPTTTYVSILRITLTIIDKCIDTYEYIMFIASYIIKIMSHFSSWIL